MTAPTPALTPSEHRVAQALRAHGLPGGVVVLNTNASTAQMAADALGVALGQIVKSLVFVDAATQAPLMVLVSGANRVHERRTSQRLGITLARADAAIVRKATGFAIGGVSPFGHPAPLPLFLDDDLFAFPSLWAAAGNARSVFEITPADLLSATGATRVCVT